MSLSKTQQEFTVKIAELINFATAIGCQLTFGDAFRDPRVHRVTGEVLQKAMVDRMLSERPRFIKITKKVT